MSLGDKGFDKQTVALAMIIKAGDKSEAKMLSQALGSISGYVDAIYLQLNTPKGVAVTPEIRNVAEQFTDVHKIYTYEWKDNFVDARNHIFAKVGKKYDWIMWLDSDDTVDNPEMIQPVVSTMPDSVHGLYVVYDYNHDEFGNTTVSHWVTRVVRNDGSFRWKSSIDDAETAVHETLVAKRNVTSVANNEWKIMHHDTREHSEASLLRNIRLLQAMYDRQSAKGEIDPRILFYLASHLYEAYNFKQVKQLLYEYLKLSGWGEERAEAHVMMGRILKMEENNQMAKTAFLLAIGESFKNVSAYYELAKLEFENKRYDQSVEILRAAVAIKQKITPMVNFNNNYQMYSLLAESLANMGGKELDESIKWINKALKLRPYDPNLKQARERVMFLLNHRDNMKAANRLVRQLEKDEQSEKIIPLLNALPNDLSDTPPVISARQKYIKSSKWPLKSIAIYTGNASLGIWGPWSLNEGGIGGSEEAVVRLSQEMVQRGWEVTVFGTPGERAGMHNGVTWKQYWEMNTKDEFDILIAWRQPNFFDFKFKARKTYLWLHDVVPKEEFTKERIDNFDRAIFVSHYHANRPEFAGIPNKKKFISSNGINPEDFEKLDGLTERDPHRCIYMSANERGLRILYDIWPEVRKAVPDATLDVYYGWESFTAIQRDNPERMMWMADMQRKAKELDGVTERGRIGQDELNVEAFKSGIWAYPTFFPEVNCITGQKAMACGAVPVTSDYAVLKDIIQYGEQVPMHNFDAPDIERYKKRLIGWLKNPEKQESIRLDMERWARENFTWSKTAEGWDEEML